MDRVIAGAGASRRSWRLKVHRRSERESSVSNALRLVIVGIMLVSFTACTSLQPIRDFTPSKIRNQVHVGDQVLVVWRSGTEYKLRVTAIDADALHGTTDAGKSYKVLFEGIRSIDVEKSSAGQTGIWIGAAVTAFIILLLLSLKVSDPGSPDTSSGSESGSGG